MMTLNDGKKFNDGAAFEACKKLEAQFVQSHSYRTVKWDEVYPDEAAIIEDLKKVYIPQSRGPLGHCFKGYEYIYSFAFYVRKGWELSPRQMTQAKRLALEIKKAALASSFVTD